MNPLGGLLAVIELVPTHPAGVALPPRLLEVDGPAASPGVVARLGAVTQHRVFDVGVDVRPGFALVVVRVGVDGEFTSFTSVLPPP
ncbi:MAG: hypothetical protein GEU71_15730 [Actinobacteria bacterium]|nr:hypothetical protein [Actinomycetota bacterium]